MRDEIKFPKEELTEVEETLVDKLRLDDFVDQLIRHWLVSFVVFGNVPQDIAIVAPVL